MDRQLWVIVERISLLIFVVGLTAPFLAGWLGYRAGKRIGHTRVGTSLGIGLGVLAMPVALWFAMCTPPVGRGATAEKWYRDTAPLIAALTEYQQQRGAYPDSLRDLVPTFLAASALSTVRMAENGSLSYQRDTAGYSLRFEYHGPGMNHCTYRPRIGEWKCGGYF